VRTFSDKGKGETFRCRRPHIFGEKKIGFFEIYGVSAQTRGVESVRTFFGQEESIGQFFEILCGRILWTAPYWKAKKVIVIRYVLWETKNELRYDLSYGQEKS